MVTEYNDIETAGHIKRISEYSGVIAAGIGMNDSEVELIKKTSLMHDIGKMWVPNSILLKPGKLDCKERIIMEHHTIFGFMILFGLDYLFTESCGIISLTHHEKWDGTGYPNGLKGEEIPIIGRVVALADVFDALTSKRPYKRAWTLEEAVDTIKHDSGAHFDPEIVRCFIDCFDLIESIYIKYKRF
jgi:putative two-component system response regulator